MHRIAYAARALQYVFTLSVVPAPSRCPGVQPDVCSVQTSSGPLGKRRCHNGRRPAHCPFGRVHSCTTMVSPVVHARASFGILCRAGKSIKHMLLPRNQIIAGVFRFLVSKAVLDNVVRRTSNSDNACILASVYLGLAHK